MAGRSSTSSAASSNRTLVRVAGLLRPYSRQLTIALLLMIALTVVNIAVPQLIAMVFDRVFPNRDLKLLWVLLASMVALYVLRNLLYFQSKFTAVKVGEDVAFNLRNRLFERLQHMNMLYYRNAKPGQLSSRVMNDSLTLQQFIQDDLPTLLQAVLLFGGVAGTMFYMNWRLATAAMIVLPLHVLAYVYFRRPMRTASRSAQAHLADAMGNLIEKLLGIEVVKGFTGEQRETLAFQQAIDRSRRSQIRSQRYYVLQKVFADLLISLGVILLMLFGAYQVVKNKLRPGDFIAFFWYVKMLYPTVLDLMSGFAKLTKVSASVEKAFEVLDTPLRNLETVALRLRPQIRGALRFENVGFTYAEGQPVFKNASFTVRAGHVCAIVGPSGSGKSTLASLVPRFMDPTEGRLLIDKVDVRKIELSHLRRSIGIAFQECFLFNTTVLENLRYANPGADAQRIIDVAKRTGAHEFIEKLPKGYDTVLGESGVSLSRGQKQLMTLTRAMLKNPKILILDEATSSIDETRESTLIPTILEFMRGKTTLMITHKPELLKHADMVVKIEEGKVEEVAQPRDGGADMVDDVAGEEPGGSARSSSSGSWWRPSSSLAMIGMSLLMWLMVSGISLAADKPADKPAAKPAAKAEAKPEDKPAEAPAEKAPEPPPPPPAPAPKEIPADQQGLFLSQDDLPRHAAAELLQVLAAQVQAELGYGPANEEQVLLLPPPPSQLNQQITLTKQGDDGLRLVQLGYQTFYSQPTYVWIFAATIKDGQRQTNGDMAAVVKLLDAARKPGDNKPATMTVGDLDSHLIKLSYVNTNRCLGVLKSLGYQVIEHKKEADSVVPSKDQLITPTAKIDPNNLPIVIEVPQPQGVDLVGPASTAAGSFGITSSPSAASDLPNLTSAAPMADLMVLSHPDHPQQYANLLHAIRTYIDLPARQILMEAMVLEISETGLNKLGVRWNLKTGWDQGELTHLDYLRGGRRPRFESSNDEIPTLEIGVSDIVNHWSAKLAALIRDGDAEILSRPSVLTLDGRVASIRVGEEIPIAKSFRGVTGGDTVQLDFGYIPVGILLNVRPRISADSDEISMQIDGVVSAEVPGEDLVIRTNNGDELGRAPRISSRRVQTYARIANNTPFIIGGLVSKDNTTQVDKIPLLGDLPWIGKLFSNTTKNTLKREVIIVITPYVLPEDQLVGRNMPQDEDAFDSFDNELFRDAYRIRTEDVFDLSFLTGNHELRHMQQLADKVVSNNADLAYRYPFRNFVDGRIPGEWVLVFRQMYEVIKRKDLADSIDPDKLILFKPQPESASGFSVTFLKPQLEKMVDQDKKGITLPLQSPFNKLQSMGKALQITFTLNPDSDRAEDIMRQPVPLIQLVDCPDSKTWSDLLWKLNQPDEQDHDRCTILLRNDEDVTRLKRAIQLKRTVTLNASRGELTLKNFSIGHVLLMPDTEPDKVHLIDSDVARYFFYTEQYYPALQKFLSRDIDALKQALEDPQYAQFLD